MLRTNNASISTGLILGLLTSIGLFGSTGFLVSEAQAACTDSASAGVNWQKCRKRNLIMTGSNLKGANLKSASFTSSDFSNSDFSGADFTKVALMRARFKGINGENTNFTKTSGSRVSFEKANLTNANFEKAELTRVSFAGAEMTGTNFAKSEIGRAVFTGATLGGNDFSFAVVARADFRDSNFNGQLDLTGAYTFQTRFEGVNLTDVIGLTQWQIDLSCGDDDTKLPAGITKPQSWPCKNIDDE